MNTENKMTPVEAALHYADFIDGKSDTFAERDEATGLLLSLAKQKDEPYEKTALRILAVEVRRMIWRGKKGGAA